MTGRKVGYVDRSSLDTPMIRLRLVVLIFVLTCTTSGLIYTTYSALATENNAPKSVKKHNGHSGVAGSQNGYTPRIYSPPTMIKTMPEDAE